VLAAPSSAATPDAWITTKTKLALLTTAGISWTGMQAEIWRDLAPQQPSNVRDEELERVARLAEAIGDRPAMQRRRS
jgi:hypothetical protein